MSQVATGQFASTFVGQFLIPLLVVLVGALIIGMFEAARRVRKAADTWQRAVGARLDRQDSMLDRIEGEVHTNGGNSLKDAVLRVIEQQKASSDLMDRHLRDAAYQLGRLDHVIEREAGHS